MDGALSFFVSTLPGGFLLVEGRLAMLESLWPDVARDAAKGVLAGGASLAVQWLAPKLVMLIRRARARLAARRVSRAREATRGTEVDPQLPEPIYASALRRTLRALGRRRSEPHWRSAEIRLGERSPLLNFSRTQKAASRARTVRRSGTFPPRGHLVAAGAQVPPHCGRTALGTGG
jgi:hypothetical protein